MYRYVFLFFVVWLPLQLGAQGYLMQVHAGYDSVRGTGRVKILGTVISARSEAAVPFATLLFTGTTQGFMADVDGHFEYVQNVLPSGEVKVQAIGFKPAFFKIGNTDTPQVFNVVLQPATNELGEVVIRQKGGDPALRLIRNIIKHKPEHDPERMKSYQYKAYTRMELDMTHVKDQEQEKRGLFSHYAFAFQSWDSTSEAEPFLPAYVTECLSTVYHSSAPVRDREVIEASMVKGVNNIDVTKYTGATYPVMNAYANSIPVVDKKFVSPISDQGSSFYHYKITDTLQAYGRTLYQISFRPKREGELCFKGDLWVVDGEFAIQSITMEVPKTVNLNWVDRISLSQEYAPIGDKWFGKQDKMIVGVSANGSEKVVGLIARKTTRYHDIRLNDTCTVLALDSLKHNDFISLNGKVTRYDNEWWATNRPDSLTKAEREIEHNVDTVLSLPITKLYINFFTVATSGVKDVGPIELGPYWYLYSSNPHEGDRVRLSLGTPRTIDNFHLTGYLAYGFKDVNYKYGLEERWIIHRKPWTYLHAKVIHDLSQGGDNINHEIQTDNLFAGLLRKQGKPWKQAFTDLQRVEYFRQYFSGFSTTAMLQHNTFTPFAPLPGAQIFRDGHGNPTDRLVTSEVGLDFRYAFRENYIEGKYNRTHVGTKFPVLDLTITQGLPAIDAGDYKYTKMRFSVNETISIPPFGHIEYTAYAGKIVGAVPYPVLNVLPGNEYQYFDSHSFQLIRNYQYITDQYAGFKVEHDLGGGLFNQLPLVRRLKLRQFWNARGIIGTLSPGNTRLNLDRGYPFQTLKGNPYLEVGTGVANIFRLLRFDFVWRLLPTPVIGESHDAYFGVFVSLQLQF